MAGFVSFATSPKFAQRGLSRAGGRGSKIPGIRTGFVAVDGTVKPWLTAPIGSIYVRADTGNVGIYLKTADNGATADWDLVTVT